MATIRKQAPNGQMLEFPEGTSEDVMNKYMAQDKFNAIQKKRGAIKDMGIGLVDGVRDGVQSTVDLAEGLSDTLGEATTIGGFVFGEDAKNGLIGYENFAEFKANKRKGLLFGEKGVNDGLTLPDFDGDPHTWQGNLAKGVSQFATGWFTGGRVLGVAGKLTGASKKISPFFQASKTGQFLKMTGKGAIADFTAFNEETGRLADMITEHAPHLENPLFDYLSSEGKEEGFYEARFKNALEGGLVGGGIEVALRTFRYFKNGKKLQEGKAINKKQLAEDEAYLKELKEEDVVKSKYKPLSEEEAVKVNKSLQGDLDDAIINQFKEAQKKSPNKEMFDSNIENLDLSLNFNVRQFLKLDKEGLLSLDAFNKTYEKLIKSKKIVVSDEIVEKTARKLYGNNPNKLEIDIKELEQVMRTAPHKVMAMNSYITTLGNGASRLAKLGNKEPKIQEYFLKSFFPKWKAINEQKLSIDASSGRVLRMSGKTGEDPIVVGINNAVKEIENYGGDIKVLIDQMAKAGDTNIDKVLNFATKNKTWDIANEVWINALLSNPKTHIINLSSNLTNVFIRPLEKMVGSRLSTTLLENPDKVAKLRLEGERALATYVGLRRHLVDATRYMKLAFNKEDTILSKRGKIDIPEKAIQKRKLIKDPETGLFKEVLDNDSTSGKFINTLGKAIRYPTRFLNAEDEFFRQITYRTELEKQGVREAIKNGKSKTKIVATDLKTKKPITEFDQAVSDYFDEGFDEFGTARNPEAMKKADENTYTQELDGIFEYVQNMTNKFPIMKQIIPFVRTPANLMLNVIDRTPLGLMRKPFYEDFIGRNGAERMAQARGGMATGTVLLTLGSILHREGIITGSQGQLAGEGFTNSQDLRNLRKNTGALPYAFRYFDEESGKHKYVQFGRFDPFGAFFGMIADFNEMHDKLTEEEMRRVGGDFLITLARQGGDAKDYLSTGTKIANFGSASWSALSRNLVSKTYLKGLADFMEVLTSDDTSKWRNYKNSKIGSFYPNVFAKLVNDPFYKDARTILDEAKKRTGLGEVEDKYDFRGNKLRIQGSETQRFVNGLFNPFNYAEEKEDPVASEILRLGVNMPMMRDSLRGDIDLTLFKTSSGQTAYNKQMELLGKVKIKGLSLDERLQNAINSDYYKRLSDPISLDNKNKDEGTRARYLKQIVKTYHTAVEEEIIRRRSDFKSTKDDTGNFTLENSIMARDNFKRKTKIGLEINKADLDGLYQFSK
tara:strand:+ start:4515 stop:8210 length:3696 start_codon:yes stop_codon:yes gene_type:complete